MQPIQDILNRIKWDPEYGEGVFEIGIYDRVGDVVLRRPLNACRFDPDQPGMVFMTDARGVEQQIPFHRIRRVWKDGALIWDRG